MILYRYKINKPMETKVYVNYTYIVVAIVSEITLYLPGTRH